MAETDSETEDIFETVGDLQVAFLITDPYEPPKLELSEAGKKARERFKIQDNFQPLSISKLRNFIEEEVYGYVQTMEYECSMCGDRFQGETIAPPKKCDCGNRDFVRVPNFNSKSGVFGPLMASFYEKEGELYMEFANKNKNSSKIVVQDALKRLDGFVNTLRRIQKESEKMIDDEEGDFDLDMIESGTSSESRSRMKQVKEIVEDMTGDSGDMVKDGPEISKILDRAEEEDIEREKAEEVINRLKRDGELFEPAQGQVHKI